MAVLMASGILFTSAFTSFPFSIASVKGEDDVTQTEEVSATTILEGIQYPSPAGENKYQVNLSSVSEAFFVADYLDASNVEYGVKAVEFTIQKDATTIQKIAYTSDYDNLPQENNEGAVSVFPERLCWMYSIEEINYPLEELFYESGANIRDGSVSLNPEILENQLVLHYVSDVACISCRVIYDKTQVIDSSDIYLRSADSDFLSENQYYINSTSYHVFEQGTQIEMLSESNSYLLLCKEDASTDYIIHTAKPDVASSIDANTAIVEVYNLYDFSKRYRFINDETETSKIAFVNSEENFILQQEYTEEENAVCFSLMETNSEIYAGVSEEKSIEVYLKSFPDMQAGTVKWIEPIVSNYDETDMVTGYKFLFVPETPEISEVEENGEYIYTYMACIETKTGERVEKEFIITKDNTNPEIPAVFANTEDIFQFDEEGTLIREGKWHTGEFSIVVSSQDKVRQDDEEFKGTIESFQYIITQEETEVLDWGNSKVTKAENNSSSITLGNENESGNWYCYVRAIDKENNPSDVRVVKYRVDKVEPTFENVQAVCEVVGNQDDNKNHIKITGVVFDDLSGLSEDTLKLTARKNANYFNENDITVEITPIDGRENAYQFVVCIYDSINENDIIDLIAYDNVGNEGHFEFENNNELVNDISAPVISEIHFYKDYSELEKNEENLPFVVTQNPAVMHRFINQNAYVVVEVLDNRGVDSVQLVIHEDTENAVPYLFNAETTPIADNRYIIQIRTDVLPNSYIGIISIQAIDTSKNLTKLDTFMEGSLENAFEKIIVDKNAPKLPKIESDDNKYIYINNDDKPSYSFHVNAEDDVYLTKVEVSIENITNPELKSEEKHLLVSGEPITDGTGNVVFPTSITKDVTITKNMSDANNENTYYLIDGKYSITFTAYDLAGNVSESETIYNIIVDTKEPQVTNLQLESNQRLYGNYANHPVEISFSVDEPEFSSGLDSIRLLSGDNEVQMHRVTVDENETKHFSFIIPVDIEILPKDYYHLFENLSLAVNDLAGNASVSALTAIQSEQDINSNDIMLENTNPTAKILYYQDRSYQLPAAVQEIRGEKWYPYNVYAQLIVNDFAEDGFSGIDTYSLHINEQLIRYQSNAEDSIKHENELFGDANDVVSVERYAADDSGNYQLIVEATDNAGNPVLPYPNSDMWIDEIHIDSTAPKILEYYFTPAGVAANTGNNNIYDLSKDLVEVMDYGFYFKEDTDVTILADDTPDINGSSGVKEIRYQIIDNFGNVKDTQSITVDLNNPQIVIPMNKGFKGNIIAYAVDYVGHESVPRTPDSVIVESQEDHDNTSSIDFDYDESDVKDADGNSLYQDSVPMKIIVEDPMSGIDIIQWSISDDNESGSIQFENGTEPIISGSGVAIDDVQVENLNLVTRVTFSVSVDSNTNSNRIDVTLQDRAGNTSSDYRIVSIDKTDPEINVIQDLEGYYNEKQTIDIEIKERNFDTTKPVIITINGEEQAIIFHSKNYTEGSDENVYGASYTFSDVPESEKLNSDIDYSYFIEYSDMAGRKAKNYESKNFTIDMKPPQISIEFDNNVSYNNTRYFSDKRTATITITERNFNAENVVLEINGKPETAVWKVKENDSTAYYFERTFGGNKKENNDLIEADFSINVKCTDKAGNSYEKHEDTFYIDQIPPRVSIEGVTVGNPNKSSEIIPVVSIEDVYLNNEDSNVTLSGNKRINEQKEGISSQENISDKLTYTFNNIEDDDIYSFDIFAIDLAGNASKTDDKSGEIFKTEDITENITEAQENLAGDIANEVSWFSVNRNGSTFAPSLMFDDDPVNLDNYFFKSKNENETEEDTPHLHFMITEINVNPLQIPETSIRINCIDNDEPPIEIEPDADEIKDTGTLKYEDANCKITLEKDKNDWCLYKYEITPTVFNNSGEYTVDLKTVDEAQNTNTNELNPNSDSISAISFFVDNYKPNIELNDADSGEMFPKTSSDGKDGVKSYNETEKKIKLRIYDNSYSSKYYSNPPTINTVVTLALGDEEPTEVNLQQDENDENVYYFTLDNNSKLQDLTITVIDRAGNKNTTAEDEDEGLKNILISPSFWVRLYYNKPVFFTSIGGSVALLVTVIVLLAKKKSRNA